MTIPKGRKPTADQIAEVRDAVRRPIEYDEDCPKQTAEQLKRFRRVNPRGSSTIEQPMIERTAQ
ncbi:MAG: hypothetical protein IJU71_13225 [Selenomonadaceae bacterium]|nr:hypothetical protein [Selenomonadaceae bacterium]